MGFCFADGYIQPMKDLLTEVKETNGSEFELVPWRAPIILDHQNIDLGYKIHSATADPLRIMSLTVSPLRFQENQDGTQRLRLNVTTKQQISEALLAFWDGQNAERHVLVQVQ